MYIFKLLHVCFSSWINKNTAPTNPEQQTNSKPHVNDKNLRRILDNHASVFSGMGKLKNKQVELATNETVTPVAHPQRKIPFHLRSKVENEIEKLPHDDIIETIPENTPTEWVSPVVTVPNMNNNIRRVEFINEHDIQYQPLNLFPWNSTAPHSSQNFTYVKPTTD